MHINTCLAASVGVILQITCLFLQKLTKFAMNLSGNESIVYQWFEEADVMVIME